MSETLSLFQPSFNRSVRVETRTERLSGGAGFLLLRASMVHCSGFPAAAAGAWGLVDTHFFSGGL